MAGNRERLETGSPVDRIHERLTGYAHGLSYDAISPEAAHTIKVRLIDTLGVAIAGFDGESCAVARRLAARMPDADGATVIGTSLKTTVEMAAFANATTARFAELNDFYHWPGSAIGHPSDVVMPVLAVAEHARLGGRELITALTIAYEVYIRLADATLIPGYDAANFGCIAIAAGAGRALGLTREQLANCIALAVVPNGALNQSRKGRLTMWKGAAAGQAGRAGVFAALLAREGMEGPHLPFEGEAGWCNLVAQKSFTLEEMGGEGGAYFKVLDTSIKPRASSATAMAHILAAEQIAPALGDIDEVERVVVETHQRALENCAGPHMWHPTTRETADHSIPYVVAAALKEGTVMPRQYRDECLNDPRLRALMTKLDVVVNPEFTRAFEQHVHHCTRITVTMRDGTRHVGEHGGPKGDLSDPVTDVQIEQKFRTLAEEALGAERVKSALEMLWRVEDLRDVSVILPCFAMS